MGRRTLFSTFARLTESGGGIWNYLGNAHKEPTNFRKGLPLWFIRLWSWILTDILKLGLVNILNFKFSQEADVWSRFWSWCMVVIMKFDSSFVFELMIWPKQVTLGSWTQPSGPLCLWKCFFLALSSQNCNCLSTECAQYGGVAQGACAAGFGVCCVLQVLGKF